MPTAEARVRTARPERYLTQLCKHFDNKGRHLGHRPRAHDGDAQALRAMQAVARQAQVEWTDTDGAVSLPWGRIDMRAGPGVLTLRVESADEENLRRLQDLAAEHVERFGRRDGLKVTWQRLDDPADLSGEAVVAPAVGGRGPRRWWRIRTIGLAAALMLVLAVHLGLGSALMANWRWTGWAVGAILAVGVVKILVLGGFAVHRGRGAKGR